MMPLRGEWDPLSPEMLLLVERGRLPAVIPDMLTEGGRTEAVCVDVLESGESGMTLSRKYVIMVLLGHARPAKSNRHHSVTGPPCVGHW